MECSDAREGMHAVLDGSATAEAAALVEGHAASCEGCRVRFGALRAVDRVVASRDGTEGAGSAAAKKRLFALLDGEGALPPPKRQGRLIPFPLLPALRPLAAVAALVAAVALWRLLPGPGPILPGGESRAPSLPSSPPSASVPSSLTGEEREIVALLDLLESPVIPDGEDGEGADVEEFLANSEGGRG